MNENLRGWLTASILGCGLYFVTRPEKKPEPLQPEIYAVPEYEGLLDTDPAEVAPPVMQVTQASVAPAKRNDTWHTESGAVNYFRIVMLETKRREALGRAGRELERYKDGDTWAIGYGNHIKYLSAAWKRTIKRQGYRVTEQQARSLMYETFHNLEQQVKSDLPHLNPRQRWAVKSLAFNWGYGNVKRSGLWRHLKAGAKGKNVAAAWMRTQVATGNHRTSRRMEVALWNGDDAAVLKVGKNAYNALKARGDFEHY
jgi:GH24 family phage-related lysozyme (muramidase)